MLADRIRELSEYDELAVELGEAARIPAQARHAPERIVRDLMAATKLWQNIVDPKI